MAHQIKSYYQTTPIDDDTLLRAINSCKDQENKILQLYKKYICMTTWDVYEVYNDVISPILPSSVGRSINTLLKLNVLISIGTIPGENGRPVNLYRLVDNPPDVVERKLNKSIPNDIKVKILYTEEGKLDVEKMLEEFFEKTDKFEQTFNL